MTHREKLQEWVRNAVESESLVQLVYTRQCDIDLAIEWAAAGFPNPPPPKPPLTEEEAEDLLKLLTGEADSQKLDINLY